MIDSIDGSVLFSASGVSASSGHSQQHAAVVTTAEPHGGEGGDKHAATATTTDTAQAVTASQAASRGDQGGREEGGAAGEQGRGESAGKSEATQDRFTQSPEAEAVVAELKQRDQEVRAHEQAHMAAGGAHVRGGASFTYQKGPDGQRYAVGGEVSIDTSEVAGDPRATMAKAQMVMRAALAPANPSGQDMSVAASAAQTIAKARIEMAREAQEQLQPVTEQAGEAKVGNGEQRSPGDGVETAATAIQPGQRGGTEERGAAVAVPAGRGPEATAYSEFLPRQQARQPGSEGFSLYS